VPASPSGEYRGAMFFVLLQNPTYQNKLDNLHYQNQTEGTLNDLSFCLNKGKTS
jgi:hypothetical protein